MITAATLTTNAMGYDFHMLIARRGDLWALGGSWAGDMAGGGFRGEVLASQRAKQTVVGAIDPTEADGMMASAALSGDYPSRAPSTCMSNRCTTALGLRTNTGLFYPQAQDLGLLSPARWSLFAEVSMISPRS